VLLGTFKADMKWGLGLGAVAGTGVILGASYMLWMVQRVFFGRVTHQENLVLKDLNRREILAAVPFLALILVMGLYPQPVLDVLNHSTNRFVARVKVGAQGATADERQERVFVRQLPTEPIAQRGPADAFPPSVVPRPGPFPVPVRPVTP
jgi:NADH-quinone oxidoreductase subunit M